jgi:hypothetical protein
MGFARFNIIVQNFSTGLTKLKKSSIIKAVLKILVFFWWGNPLNFKARRKGGQIDKY